VSAATPGPLLQNLVDAGVVDESNVFGGTRDDNDDFLLSLINADLPSEDLDLGVWKLLAAVADPQGGLPGLQPPLMILFLH
jgi:hypothetical protein